MSLKTSTLVGCAILSFLAMSIPANAQQLPLPRPIHNVAPVHTTSNKEPFTAIRVKDVPMRVLAPSDHKIVEHATAEDISIIGYFENKPLFLGNARLSFPHYGGGRNDGCTIGYGINLAWRSNADIIATLAPVIGKERAKNFLVYAGKFGNAARKLCGKQVKHTAETPHLTAAEAWKILGHEVDKRKKKVIARAKVFKALDDMNGSMLAIMVSLDYQSPSCSSQAKTTWQKIARGQLTGALKEIRYDCYTVAKARRKFEATYFHNAAQQRGPAS